MFTDALRQKREIARTISNSASLTTLRAGEPLNDVNVGVGSRPLLGPEGQERLFPFSPLARSGNQHKQKADAAFHRGAADHNCFESFIPYERVTPRTFGFFLVRITRRSDGQAADLDPRPTCQPRLKKTVTSTWGTRKPGDCPLHSKRSPRRSSERRKISEVRP